MKKKELSYKIIYSEIYEEIYELRKAGFSYQGIAKHFHEHGIKINEREIEEVCKEIFNEKGEKQYRGRKIPHEKSERQKKIDARICELRNNGLTFNSIIAYFQNRGIKIEVKDIRAALKEARQEEEKTEEVERYDEDWLKEKIYELREQELSYAKIEKYFLDSGIKISLDKVKKLCKEIYSEKGKEEPKIKREFPKRLAPVISDDVIRILKEKKWSDEKIAIYLNRKGIKVSEGYIAGRSRELYARLGKEKPRTPKFNNTTGKTILEDVQELERLEEDLRELFEQKEQTAALVEAFEELNEDRSEDEER